MLSHHHDYCVLSLDCAPQWRGGLWSERRFTGQWQRKAWVTCQDRLCLCVSEQTCVSAVARPGTGRTLSDSILTHGTMASILACVRVSLDLSTRGDVPVWAPEGVSLLSSSSRRLANLFMRIFFVFSTAGALKVPVPPTPRLPLWGRVPPGRRLTRRHNDVSGQITPKTRERESYLSQASQLLLNSRRRCWSARLLPPGGRLNLLKSSLSSACFKVSLRGEGGGGSQSSSH